MPVMSKEKTLQVIINIIIHEESLQLFKHKPKILHKHQKVIDTIKKTTEKKLKDRIKNEEYLKMDCNTKIHRSIAEFRFVVDQSKHLFV